MFARRLVFLGATALPKGSDALRCEGQAVRPGDAFVLERRRAPWSDSRPHVRVIVGSHRSRADLLIEGPGILPEHARLYYPREGDGKTDLRALRDDTVTVDGDPAPAFEWIALDGGEELTLGPWRWRFELVSGARNGE